MSNKDRHIFLFGWDAATWSIIDQLRSFGKLPNLDKMIREGASGTLIAEEPILSPSVWTTIASGKRKEKHGILDFNVSARHVKCKRIWDILQEHGFVTGTYGHFVTWPPTPVSGFNVPGLLAADDETYPPELTFLRTAFETDSGGNRQSVLGYAAKALMALGYGLTPGNLFQILRFLLWSRLRSKERLQVSLKQSALGILFRFSFFMKLFKCYQPHYSFFHAHIIDGASHRCWRYLEPEKFPGTPDEDVRKYGNAIFNAYELLDKMLGKFIRRFGNKITYVVISDHGIGPGEGKIKPVMHKVRVEKLMELIGAGDVYRAIDRGFNVVYLRPKEEDSTQVIKHSEMLASICFEETGEKLFSVDMESDSIFLIDRFDKETVAERMDEMIVINGEKYPLMEIISEMEIQTSGWHHPEGVFIIKGDGIKMNLSIGKIQQPDITPTLLHLYGLPAGKDMDGRVLKEIFEEEFLRSNPPEHIDSYEKPGDIIAETDSMELSDDVKRQLRDLGYFS